MATILGFGRPSSVRDEWSSRTVHRVSPTVDSLPLSMNPVRCTNGRPRNGRLTYHRLSSTKGSEFRCAAMQLILSGPMRPTIACQYICAVLGLRAPKAATCCLKCRLFRDRVQFYSGLVDLVVRVGGYLSGAPCLALARERFVVFLTEDSAQMSCRTAQFRVRRHGEGS
jgi:hypothetical protein